MTPRTLLFCNKSPSKRSLLPLKPFHFGTNSQSKFDVFRISFLDTLFSSTVQDDVQQLDLGTPLEIQLGPKWRPKSAKWHQRGPKKHRCASFGAHPLFSRNHSNYRAFGTWWLLKGHLLMAVCSFSILSTFLCALFYTICKLSHVGALRLQFFDVC